MSVGSIKTILHDHLHVSKVSARSVPRLLTPNQKEQRADSCKELILLESRYSIFLSNPWPWMKHGFTILILKWNHHQCNGKRPPLLHQRRQGWNLLSGLSPVRSHIALKDFCRSKKEGRNVSICRVTMWRSNKMWCKVQLSSLIPS